ncbi:hypothetical protein ACHQM5_022893 [Ranunculus cassubicifolius]
MAKAKISPSNPHFFKPIMPGSLEQISIPKAFMVNYLGGENFEGKSLLKTKTGKSWDVTIKNGSFTDGWETFVTENDLCIGDILVFKHEGDLKFDVIMFNSTACEKQYPPLDVSPEENNKTDQVPRRTKMITQSVKNCPHFTRILKRHNLDCQPILSIPTKFGRENGLTNKKCEITLKEANGKCWNASLRYKQSADLAYIRGGWREFSEANQLKLGDTCKFKLVSCVPSNIIMEVSISRSKYSGSKATSKVKRLGSSPTPPPPPCSPPPEFTVTLQPYSFNKSAMNIPAKFVRENRLRNRVGMIKLIDPKGKSWEVNLRCEKSQVLLGAGWREFSDANKLKLGEKCTFKLVSKGSKNIIMEVWILRSKCSV